MSILLSVIILIIIALIQALLQLVPGVFASFYHHALGKKNRKFADSLSLYFLLGNEVFIITIFFILCILFFTINNFFEINIIYLYWILAGIFTAETTISLFLYYRKGKFTELFISRSIASSLEKQSKNIKTPSDAFILGFLSRVPELIFTLPLYLLAIILLIDFLIVPRALILILFILISLLPIIIIHLFYFTGHNLSHIERFRIKIKPFIKIFLSLSFLSLATLIIIGIFIHG